MGLSVFLNVLQKFLSYANFIYTHLKYNNLSYSNILHEYM